VRVGSGGDEASDGEMCKVKSVDERRVERLVGTRSKSEVTSSFAIGGSRRACDRMRWSWRRTTCLSM
jgi:hypothetical protein